MPPKDEQNVLEGFFQAIDQPDGRREAVLQQFCGGNYELYEEIKDLLCHYRESDGFLARPVLENDLVRTAFLEGASLTGKRFGDYEVVRELGRGGMACVYLCNRADGSYAQQVAVKVLDHHHSPMADRARFQQELRILGELGNPNIVQIKDAGIEDGFAYYVMEYVNGSHIDVYCKEKALDTTARLRLFIEVCAGVSLAHSNQIVHRDLKPGNILVDQSGTPKLIDFGIAKILDSTAGTPQTVRGLELMTLQYASPEQISGSSDTSALPSSDIYSLGVVLFEMLTGRRPIEPDPGMPRAGVPRYLIETEPRAPSSLAPSLGKELDTIVLKALRKDRLERYKTVDQFVSYIELYLNHRPLPEDSGSLLRTAQKFLRRNRTPIAVGTLLLTTMFIGIISTQRQAQIAKRRFEDVRQLATSFLFDFDQAISKVQGTIQARRLVVAKGLEYLDKLARDAGDDDSLKLEIAAAYERLAGIQGNVYGSNLGEFRQAAESYKKALEIRKELSRKFPSNSAFQEALGNSYLQFADGWFTTGNTAAAAAEYQKGIAILEPLFQAKNRPKGTASDLQRGYSRMCNFLLSNGDQRGAISNCYKSIDLAKILVAADPTDPLKRAALAAAYGVAGNALRLDKRPREALSQLALAEHEFRLLTTEQPGNGAFARNLGGTYAVEGALWMELAESDEAVSSFRKSNDILRGMVDLDPADIRPKMTLGFSLTHLAAVLQKLGRRAEAVDTGREGLLIYYKLADRPQASPDDLNNYASFLNTIEVPELRNPKVALTYAKRAVAAVKEPDIVFLSTLADSFAAVGDFDQAIVAAKRGLQTGLPASGNKAGVHADLERNLETFERLRAGGRK